MSQTSDEYWQKVTAALAEDGPPDVPAALAARATQRALSAVRDEPGFFDVLLSMLRPAVLVTATAAAVVWVVVGLSPGNQEATAPSQSLYASVTGQGDADSLYGSVLGAARQRTAR